MIKITTANAGGIRRQGFAPGFRIFPGGTGNLLAVLDWEIHGQSRLAGYGPWGCTKADRTRQLRTHTHSLVSIVTYLIATVRCLQHGYSNQRL